MFFEHKTKNCGSGAGSFVRRTSSRIKDLNIRRISNRCLIHNAGSKIPEIDICFRRIDVGIIAFCNHGVITAVGFHPAECRSACTVALEINIVPCNVITVNAVVAECCDGRTAGEICACKVYNCFHCPRKRSYHRLRLACNNCLSERAPRCQ